MKSLLELYQMVLNVYQDSFSTPYICNNIETLLKRNQITEEELVLFLNHFRSQYPTPTLHEEFYNSEYFRNWGIYLSWFGVNKTIRIKFLQTIIKSLEDEKVI